MANYSIYSGSIPNYVIDAASSLLSENAYDYCLFCSGNNQYILIRSSSWDEDTLTAEDGTIFVWNYDQNAHITTAYQYTYYFSAHDEYNISVSNNYGYMYFSSGAQTPGLREGGDKFAFALLLLAGICCIYYLMHEIYHLAE